MALNDELIEVLDEVGYLGTPELEGAYGQLSALRRNIRVLLNNQECLRMEKLPWPGESPSP